MPLLPLRQAAEAVGVSRQTLYRYVKDGRVSATVGHDGQKLVDTAELMRVFGALATAATTPTSTAPSAPGETVSGDSVRQPETAAETAATARETAATIRLEAELAATRTLLDAARTELDAARDREAKLLGIVESQTRLLEYRPGEKPPDPPSSNWGPWLMLGMVVAAALLAAAWINTH